MVLTVEQMQRILPPKFIISLTVLTMFSYVIAPWYGQEIIAARNEKIAVLAALSAAVIICILYGFIVPPLSRPKYMKRQRTSDDLRVPMLERERNGLQRLIKRRLPV